MLTTDNIATIARIAHRGQKYDRTDYWNGHLRKVVEELGENASEQTKQIAWLHDIVEDTNVDLSDLDRLGVDHHVIECVAWLTRGRDDPYADYIRDIVTRAPYKAALVKMADLRVNLRTSQETVERVAPGELYEQAKRRVEKYSLALLAFDMVAVTYASATDDEPVDLKTID